MSVINKMLRDLDQRQSPAAGAADPLRRHTASVAAVPARRPSPALRWATGLLPLAALVAGGFVWWSLQQAPLVPAPPSPVPQVPSVAAPVVPEAVAVASDPAPVADTQPTSAPAVVATPLPAPVGIASSGPVRLGLRMDATLSSLVAPPPPAVEALAAAPAKAVRAAASAPQAAPTPATQTPAKPQPAALDAAPAGRPQQAGREALAQAQALWASGARDTAISTLQEAVATAERSPPGAVSASLVPMVRELARMELAEGRPAVVWELLTRLEPQLVNQPELWALRANAAQRLGRHQDSVQAYTTALQSRPSEQRWLLGAAVSLAALGQTVPAAEMAEKARSVGPVSREVLAYLRQQGVPLTDRP